MAKNAILAACVLLFGCVEQGGPDDVVRNAADAIAVAQRMCPKNTDGTWAARFHDGICETRKITRISVAGCNYSLGADIVAKTGVAACCYVCVNSEPKQRVLHSADGGQR
jgi:hypothetical protein